MYDNAINTNNSGENIFNDKNFENSIIAKNLNKYEYIFCDDKVI